MSVPNDAGANFPHQMVEDYNMDYDAALATIRPGWFIDCKHKPELFDAYPNYYGHVWQCDTEWYEAAIPDIQAYQDRLWFFGNEPNVQGQSLATPKVCADTLNRVRREFPDLKIAAPGVLHGAFKGGHEWTRACLDAGMPIPDYWSWDCYEPNEYDVNTSIDNWHLMIGDDVPSIIKEAGCWLDRRDRIIEVMNAFRKAQEAKRIQAWAWFSARYESDYPFLSLLNRDGSATWVGKLWNRVITSAGAQSITYLPNVRRT